MLCGFAGGEIPILADARRRIHSSLNVRAECGIRPFGGNSDEAVFDRIEMDVVHMRRIVGAVPGI